MCLAIPGKIVEIKNDKAVVEYGNEKREAKLTDKNYKIGDYVLVSTGLVIQKIAEKDALKAIQQIKSM